MARTEKQNQEPKNRTPLLRPFVEFLKRNQDLIIPLATVVALHGFLLLGFQDQIQNMPTKLLLADLTAIAVGYPLAKLSERSQKIHKNN